MASSVMVKCWICQETFNQSLEVKSHAIDKHDVCRVVCPWCTDKKQTFKRTSELAKHCRRKHVDLVDELKDGDFFNEANGFYLAQKPEDYAKAVRPAEWTSLMAIRTRAAKSGGKDKDREHWENGWRKALGITPVHDTPVNRKRKSCYSPERTTPVQEKVRSSPLEINSISLTSISKVAYLKLEETKSQLWCKVDFFDLVVEDKKAMDNLLRRMAVIGEGTNPPAEFSTELKMDDAPFSLKQITTALGVRSQLIRRVSRSIVRVDKLVMEDLEKEDIGEEPEYEIMDSLETTEETEKASAPKETGEGQVEEARTSVDKEQETESGTSVDQEREVELETEVAKDEPKTSDLNQQRIVIEDESNKDLTDLQRRAEDLLMTGGMPLFPPGRRQWEEVWQVIMSRTPTPMYWPPMDWKTFTPEEKLAAWRFTTFSLERENDGRGCIHEREILDQYAMLALPGTKVEKVSDKTGTTTTRTANYNLICKIRRGDIKGHEACTWLDMFERAVDQGLKDMELYNILKDIHNQGRKELNSHLQ